MADSELRKLVFATTPSGECVLAKVFASRIAAELDNAGDYRASEVFCGAEVEVARQSRGKRDEFVAVDDLWAYLYEKAR